MRSPPAGVLHADGVVHEVPAGDRAPGIALLQQQVGLVDIGVLLVGGGAPVGLARAGGGGVPSHRRGVRESVIGPGRPELPAPSVGEAGDAQVEGEAEDIIRRLGAVVYGVAQVPGEGGPGRGSGVHYGVGVGRGVERRSRHRRPRQRGQLGRAGHVLHPVHAHRVHYLRPVGEHAAGHGDIQVIGDRVPDGEGARGLKGFGDAQRVQYHRLVVGLGVGGVGGAGISAPAAVRLGVAGHRRQVGEDGSRSQPGIHLGFVGYDQAASRGDGGAHRGGLEIPGEDARVRVVVLDEIAALAQGRSAQGNAGDALRGVEEPHAHGQDVRDQDIARRRAAAVVDDDLVLHRIAGQQGRGHAGGGLLQQQARLHIGDLRPVAAGVTLPGAVLPRQLAQVVDDGVLAHRREVLHAHAENRLPPAPALDAPQPPAEAVEPGRGDRRGGVVELRCGVEEGCRARVAQDAEAVHVAGSRGEPVGHRDVVEAYIGAPGARPVRGVEAHAEIELVPHRGLCRARPGRAVQAHLLAHGGKARGHPRRRVARGRL